MKSDWARSYFGRIGAKRSQLVATFPRRLIRSGGKLMYILHGHEKWSNTEMMKQNKTKAT